MFVVAVAEAVVAHDIVLGVIVPGGREITGGAVGGDPSLHEDDGALNDVGQFAHLVQHGDEGEPSFVQRGESIGKGLPGGAVDAGQGLVEDEQARVSHKSARDEDALRLPAGEDLDVIAGAVGESDGLKGRHRSVAGAATAVCEGAARAQQAGAHDLQGGGGHTGCCTDALRHIADSAPRHAGAVFEVVAEQAHAARADRVEAEDRSDQGRLA